MASVQARHSRSWASGKPWTPVALHGCDCGPTYYVVVREGNKLRRERVGKNARNADRALTQIQAQVDTNEYIAVENIKFRRFAEDWLQNLERPETTKRSYGQSLRYAAQVFGEVPVRRLRLGHVQAFLAYLQERGLSSSTRNRHLRALSSCLNSAIPRYAARNPIGDLPKKERPRPLKRERGYFTREEIPRLFVELPTGLWRVLFERALKTGMREGELLALRWRNVRLLDSLIEVRENWTDGVLKDPKTETSGRPVDLTAEAVEMLGRWHGEGGWPGEAELVFPGGGEGGHIPGSNVVNRVLYRAMKRPGIPREGENGARRTFHSFRHSYAKFALEQELPLFWLSRQLGHSSDHKQLIRPAGDCVVGRHAQNSSLVATFSAEGCGGSRICAPRGRVSSTKSPQPRSRRELLYSVRRGGSAVSSPGYSSARLSPYPLIL